MFCANPDLITRSISIDNIGGRDDMRVRILKFGTVVSSQKLGFVPGPANHRALKKREIAAWTFAD